MEDQKNYQATQNNQVQTSGYLQNYPAQHQGNCPHCGRCPTCGRGGYQTYPYWYPSTYPYWYPSTYPIWTSGGTSSGPNTGAQPNTSPAFQVWNNKQD